MALFGTDWAAMIAEIHYWTAASQKVAGAAGFRFEGMLRNAAWSRAGRGDMAVYSLIPQDLGHP